MDQKKRVNTTVSNAEKKPCTPVKKHLQQHRPTPTSIRTPQPSSMDKQHQPAVITPRSRKLQGLFVVRCQSPSCVGTNRNGSRRLPGVAEPVQPDSVCNYDSDQRVVPTLVGKEGVSSESTPAVLTWSKTDTECPPPYTSDLYLLVAAKGRGLSNPTVSCMLVVVYDE